MSGTRRIPVGATFALVDAEDYEKVAGYNWRLNWKGYVITQYMDGGRIREVRMHRLILGLLPGTCTDHVNGDKLDNRRVNIRPCTHSQNNMNKRKQRFEPVNGVPQSRFKGVRWHRPNIRSPWMASIQAYGKRKVIGCFPTEEAAARAYDTEARFIHGEFARLNFPRSGEQRVIA